MITCIIANDGTKLMPTFNIKKVRRFLKEGRAKIVCYHPFTVQLLYKTKETNVQPIEIGMDAGYQTIGFSVKSEKHEFVSAEYELLKGETEHHKERKMYRNMRRNRLRYRKARWSNRTIPKGWLAPSVRHKKEQHTAIINRYVKYMPITNITVEVGQFDTQLLEAIEKGITISGVEYQHGETYGYDTLREAVFSRDNYCCQICSKSAIKDKVILRTHHLGYLIGDRSNRMNNLLTVCTKCHTPKNHKQGGKLYGLKPKLKRFKGAAFMNSVKWQIYEKLKALYPSIDIKITYGAKTKRVRLDRNIAKSHSNDAYCIGQFLPKHKTSTLYYKKKRKNNRVLSKFYDAKYIDVRDGSIKTGQQLSCNRTNRSTPRKNPNNERQFRGRKVSKGRYSVRKQRYSLQPYDVVLYKGEKQIVKGVISCGKSVLLQNSRTSTPKNVKLIYHCNGWVLTNIA